MCAQIGSFREVLSKQSIGVLVRSALPRAVRFAEVDGKAGCDPQIRMPVVSDWSSPKKVVHRYS